MVHALPTGAAWAANACPAVSLRPFAFRSPLVARRILFDRPSPGRLRLSFSNGDAESERQAYAGFGAAGHRQRPSRRGIVERSISHAVSGPVLVGAALSKRRICPLAPGSHVNRSPCRRRPIGQSRTGSGGVLSWISVGVGREQHG